MGQVSRLVEERAVAHGACGHPSAVEQPVDLLRAWVRVRVRVRVGVRVRQPVDLVRARVGVGVGPSVEGEVSSPTPTPTPHPTRILPLPSRTSARVGEASPSIAAIREDWKEEGAPG